MFGYFEWPKLLCSLFAIPPYMTSPLSNKITHWFAVAIASLAFQTFGAPSAPMGLLVNGVSKPLAIDRDDNALHLDVRGLLPAEKGKRRIRYWLPQALNIWLLERAIGGTAAR